MRPYTDLSVFFKACKIGPYYHIKEQLA